MAREITPIRPAPWEVAYDIDYSQRGAALDLYAVHCHNTSDLEIRVSVTIGRGSSTYSRSALVQPGERRIYPATPEESVGFPVSLRGTDPPGLAVEQT